ncbi:MAG: RdgB/HAM1 family non-canonical purine NTP pyrophosphatase [Muribaculaceae bacterium]|nr:RdgB/HAM1 family non-canonical purine NTP pyrophosphatase [Muribaculaceae bacterium]
MTHSIPEIVFATNNTHKLSELRAIVGDSLRILSLAEIDCHEDIPETGNTLEENSMIKARWVKDRYGYDCIADDTGLEVEALAGAPGVHSARYAPGEGHDSQANMKLLLKNMEGVENRRARFRTVITLLTDSHGCNVVDGIVNGVIATEPRGENGFGYDPVFVPDEARGLSFAQMDGKAKNDISHRGRATRALLKLLEKF